MKVSVGDLVQIRGGFRDACLTSSINGIVYDVVGEWVHIMWSDGKLTARHSAALEVINES